MAWAALDLMGEVICEKPSCLTSADSLVALLSEETIVGDLSLNRLKEFLLSFDGDFEKTIKLGRRVELK